ncbi:hypothetical protein ACIQV3_23600 [Streptomyces sp. NPDC099050]|uniref:hypothetical protein n=1 Tax=Streptomyces sp. NPDC099050 TaxID=3366100 RepID=UPI00381DC4A6
MFLTRVRVPPKFEAALAAAREIKAHAPHCRVIFTVYEMKRLGSDAAELTALADHLAPHGPVLEMPAGPLAGIYGIDWRLQQDEPFMHDDEQIREWLEEFRRRRA